MVRLLAILVGTGLLASCTTARKPEAPTRVNPLAGMRFFVDPYSSAAEHLKTSKEQSAETNKALQVIADQPAAMWFGAWSGDIRKAVIQAVVEADKTRTHLIAVPYNIPYRDCGQHSAGGLEAKSYRQWIEDFAAGLGEHRAIIVLEPDAIPLIDCLTAETRKERWELLRFALDTFKTKTRSIVYMDVGHSNWIPANVMTDRLKEIGIDRADGFAINTSNYQSTSDSVSYAQKLVANFPDKGFVIDTSRNGLGAPADAAWCNPRGRAIGMKPQVPSEGADAYLWVKRPGESDGECNGGPKAGVFWIDIAKELVSNSQTL